MKLIPAVHRSKTLAFVELVRRGEVRPRTGIRRFLGEARAAGLRLAIASTTSAENVEALLAGSLGPGISRWFDVIATGDVVANKKPAPDIYRLALSSLGVAPRNAVAIEDSQIGVQAATAAGLVTIATPTRWTAEQDFAGAELVLRSLDDLDVEHLAALHGAALHRMENHA
ncbi:MAG: HAD family hydrolase, partial [Steroidobacteraceae bacterium]